QLCLSGHRGARGTAPNHTGLRRQDAAGRGSPFRPRLAILRGALGAGRLTDHSELPALWRAAHTGVYLLAAKGCQGRRLLPRRLSPWQAVNRLPSTASSPPAGLLATAVRRGALHIEWQSYSAFRETAGFLA